MLFFAFDFNYVVFYYDDLFFNDFFEQFWIDFF